MTVFTTRMGTQGNVGALFWRLLANLENKRRLLIDQVRKFGSPSALVNNVEILRTLRFAFLPRVLLGPNSRSLKADQDLHLQ